MSFAQGRYGIMYHPPGRARPGSSGPPWRWGVAIVCLGFAAYGSYMAVKRFKAAPAKKEPPAPAIVVPTSEKPVAKTGPVPRPAASPAETRGAATVAADRLTTADIAPSKKGKVIKIEKPKVIIEPPRPIRSPSRASPVPSWLEKALSTADADRPPMERQQLQRLAQAERDGNSAIAADAIEKIYARPAMVDLQGPLVHRLGQLNMKRLQSETNTPWTAIVKIQRGDTLERLSREHRTSKAATQMLNPGLDPTRLQIGTPIRVLNYPNAVLVIHKKLESADLFLKGSKLFKRYSLKVGDKAVPGSYPISGENGMTAASRFSQFGLKPAQASDRKELEMFLAPGSRITVADP
ncbi:MAG: LysM peptidoglycan-binding domain-containing protein [Kiritimatiellia bacterium]